MGLSKRIKAHYTREEIVNIFQECGFRAKLFEQEGLFPQIASGVGGHTFTVGLWGVSREETSNNVIRRAFFELQTLQKTSLEEVNQWNHDNITPVVATLGSNRGYLFLKMITRVENMSALDIAQEIDHWDKKVMSALRYCNCDE